MLGAGVLGCREPLAAPGSTVANGHPGCTNNLKVSGCKLLVATAHADSFEALLRNPTLQILLGGAHAVTLGDYGAKLDRA
jgi:hypothetical protein